MTRPTLTATLPGTRWAVLALIITAAVLAFDAGRAICPHAPAQTAPITRAAS